MKDGVSLQPCPPTALEALGEVQPGPGLRGSSMKAPAVSGCHSEVSSSPCVIKGSGKGRLVRSMS